MLLSTQTAIPASRLGYAQGITMLADAGYDCLDFSFFQAHREGLFDRDEADVLKFAEEIREIADDAGIPFDQTHAPYSYQRPIWENWEDNILPISKKAIKASAVLGAKTVIIHPIQYLNYRRNSARMIEETLSYYRMLRPVAEEAGIKIAVENMWQRDINRDVICSSICSDPKDFCAMVDELGTDVFTACLDVGHCGLTGWKPSELVRALGKHRLGALHVHDNDNFHDSHTLPGFGLTDWDDFCRALGEIDYAGTFTFEADNFFSSVLEDSIFPSTAEMMVQTGRHLITLVDSYRP
ncbi:MAG: sugar phosphate isomerase/epimerase [Clostridia bacterium]|nr:sugar phosphate isomerase/epimerase [Clostridia bacterium]